MTAPTQPQAQPERPSGPQAAAVADAQDYDVNALGPALAAFVAAVLAYSRGTGHLMGSPLTVARKVGYYAAVVAILRSIAGRGLDLQRAFSGPRAAEELWGGQDQGLAAGETAGLTTLAQAARVIARKARVDEARGGSPGVSLPGEPYDPQAEEITRTYSDPSQIALPVAQSTKHAAQLAAAIGGGLDPQALGGHARQPGAGQPRLPRQPEVRVPHRADPGAIRDPGRQQAVVPGGHQRAGARVDAVPLLAPAAALTSSG
jgi:hypothetical protein